MDTNISLKYIGYARKSSEDNKERQAASLPEQLYEIERLKTKENLHLVEVLQESKTAHKPGREIFGAMLKRIESGEANAIIVWHPNRLARNPIDAGWVIYLMDEGKLIEVKTPARSFYNTPTDKFMLSLEFGISKKDSDDKSEVVSRGLEKKCRDGWRPGVAPQGYFNDRQTESGFRKVLPDPERLPFIRKMFELFREGTTVMELYLMAKNEWGYRSRQKRRSGGGPLSLSMIYKILSNPFYYGKFEYPEKSGVWWKGSHEPAISEELFNEVQVLLGRRGKYTLQHHEYAFTSLLKCGFCGATITAEEKHQVICTACKWKFSITKKNKDTCTRCDTKIENMRNPTILHYTYYRCKRRTSRLCHQKGVRLDRLEQQIDAKLAEIEISPVFMDWALRQIAAMNESEKDFQEDTVASIKGAHDACRAKLNNLIQLKISPQNTDGSLLSDEQYRSQKSAIETELKGLEQQLGTIDNRMVQAAEDINEAFTFATKVRERFANGDAKLKRRILMDLGSHLTLTDRTLRLDSPPYLFTLKKMKSEAPIIGEMFAPNKESDRIRKMEAKYASIPTLLRGLESHQV
ncbi:hypothetical protein A3A79_02470 [Candidatus Gottesmanbacteria bacterium RIFCSPLOWO2_01_FULL_43_11b]|uniref:Recombinase domain-containing protein n=1 Tax=Candidatus Gottesmanbacteria bacterium RIFCSPLOWO2_01_FULL_43_11b TaxID=1798392 RepID=A0A1F6AIC6_9BACT|nr:MAG: hypothetical protein A3A79_02470 [Candidatus Gottesmanbacteria bacterium RIFCSPLOWO2_01_FULL_43_11b]